MGLAGVGSRCRDVETRLLPTMLTPEVLRAILLGGDLPLVVHLALCTLGACRTNGWVGSMKRLRVAVMELRGKDVNHAALRRAVTHLESAGCLSRGWARSQLTVFHVVDPRGLTERTPPLGAGGIQGVTQRHRGGGRSVTGVVTQRTPPLQLEKREELEKGKSTTVEATVAKLAHALTPAPAEPRPGLSADEIEKRKAELRGQVDGES